MLKKSLDFRQIDKLVVLYENKNTPADADWDAFLDCLRKNRDQFDQVRIAVFTPGGGPNAPQRKRLAEALGGKSVRVAVVSDSPIVRFIASSIALLNRQHAAFNTNEREKAYAHLGLTPTQRRQVDLALAELAETVE